MISRVVLLLLMVSPVLAAKKDQVYRCLQSDGTTVIQDRRCLATHSIQAAKTESPGNIKNKQPAKTHTGQSVQNSNSSQYLRRVVRPSSVSKHTIEPFDRSAYFAGHILQQPPSGWQFFKEETPTVHRLYLSRAPFDGSGSFESGMKLEIYPKTIQSYRKGAFERALDIYHDIRKLRQSDLIDSQFKSHPKYKVFNIKYQLPNSKQALTEFYIDEFNHDLFVLTIQSSTAEWSQHRQAADFLVRQL